MLRERRPTKVVCAECMKMCCLGGKNSVIKGLTARWLLGKIARKLSPHLAFSCSCRKIGTVLHRSGGDLIHALSLALSNVQHLSNISGPTEVGLK